MAASVKLGSKYHEWINQQQRMCQREGGSVGGTATSVCSESPVFVVLIIGRGVRLLL